MQPRSPLHRARRSPGAHGILAAPGGTWCSDRLRVSPPGGRGMAGRNGHLAWSFLRCGAAEVPPPRLALLPCRSVGGCACRRSPRVLAQAMGMDGQARGPRKAARVGRRRGRGWRVSGPGPGRRRLPCCLGRVLHLPGGGRRLRQHQPRRRWRLGPGGQGAVGCVNAFMQLGGTRGVDRRVGHAGALGLGDPRRGSLDGLGLAAPATVLGAGGAGCSGPRRRAGSDPGGLAR
jgi:hypothetical protein